MPGKIRLHTINELLQSAAKKLQPKKITCPADQHLGWLDAEILLGHVIQKEKSWLVAHGNDELSPSLEKKFLSLVERRAKHEPIAYIIGMREFYGRPFVVNKTVLIPQPDTETFIEIVKKEYKKNDAFVFLDIGTGSGAIGITIADEFPNARIIATDICKRALKVAEKNAKIHSALKQITFLQGNGLSSEIIKRTQKTLSSLERKNPSMPLIIAANLPYLPESDIAHTSKEVLFEPKKALFAKKDGLELIIQLLEKITEDLPISPNVILLEFDPPQAKMLEKTAKELFPLAKIRIVKDLAGRQRILEIKQS